MDESGKKNKPSVRSIWVMKSVKKPQDQDSVAGSVPSKAVEKISVSKEAEEEHRKSSQLADCPAPLRSTAERLTWEPVEGFQGHQLDGGSLPPSSNSKPAGSSLAPLVVSASVADEAPVLAKTLPANSLKRFQGEQSIGAALPSGGPSSESDSGGSDSEKDDDVPPVVVDRKKKKKLPVFEIPEHLKRQIEMDTVPEVLHEALSLSNYGDYFAALLYAEDFYIEKWSKFQLYRVSLELDNKKWKKLKKKKNTSESAQNDNKAIVSFKITSIPERRPYLLSRDYVFVRRSGKKTKFEGRLIGVVKSTHILTEFGNDFVSHYSPSHKYDVSFSFNRICLKRCHQAVKAALAPSFHHVLFPSCHPRKTTEISLPSTTSLSRRFGVYQMSAIHNIIRLKGPPPYLINGPPSVSQKNSLSKVGTTITEAIFQIYFHMNTSRILVCSPKNHTCDTLISCLNKRLPDSDLFRANASFREVEDVADDVLPLCSHDGEFFSSPSLSDLQKFRVIVSTFMTCFRLQNSGISPGYFSHIFMVDASSATEPDTMVALANFVTDETAVVITGSRTRHADRVRSDMARRNGLKRSYFRRLMESEPYLSNDPLCVCNLDEESEN